MRNWIENIDTGEVRIRTHAAQRGWRETWNDLEVRIDLEVAKYEGTDKIFEEWDIFLVQDGDWEHSIRLAHGDSMELVMEQLATAAHALNRALRRMGPMAYTVKHERLEAYDDETIDAIRIRQADRAEDNKQTTVAGVIEAYEQVVASQLRASRIIRHDDRGRESYRLVISNPLKGGESSGTDSEVQRDSDRESPEES